MFNRWIERGLLDVLAEEGVGCIAFSPLAQGAAHRPVPQRDPGRLADAHQSLPRREPTLTDKRLATLRALNEIASRRGQTLAQLALAWALRDPRMTSLVIGASSVAQLEQNIAALSNVELSGAEQAEIDKLVEE